LWSFLSWTLGYKLLAVRGKVIYSKMARLALVLLLAVVLVVSEGQLTFSTGWGNGKRSISTEIGPDSCTPSEEALYVIYKFIQVI
jgi:hypothetical protein